MAGPNQKTKLSLGSKDLSYMRHDSFNAIIRGVIIAIIVGISAWALCTLLKIIVEHSTKYLFDSFNHHHGFPWIFVSIIIGGSLIRAFLIRSPLWQEVEGDGASDTIKYFLGSYDDQDAAKKRYQRATFAGALRRIFITALTLGCGGSGGLEGPVIPVGEDMGAGWGNIFKVFNSDDLRAFQMAGIAAAVCTLLNTPFAAAIFAAEVVYSERIVYRTFLYSIFAVLAAYSLNTTLMHTTVLFKSDLYTSHYTLYEYLQVALVALFCSAPAGFGVKFGFVYLKKQFQRFPIVTRAPIGAIMSASIALVLWYTLHIAPDHILGMGENTISDILSNTPHAHLDVWWILFIIVIAKILATGFTLMSGGSAGLLVPAMVIGGASGSGMYYLLDQFHLVANLNPDLFAIAGIASSLVAVIEVPIASIVLTMEMFGATFAPPAMLAVAVCHLVVKNLKLYVEKDA